jgi:hypothetical protein
VVGVVRSAQELIAMRLSRSVFVHRFLVLHSYCVSRQAQPTLLRLPLGLGDQSRAKATQLQGSPPVTQIKKSEPNDACSLTALFMHNSQQEKGKNRRTQKLILLTKVEKGHQPGDSMYYPHQHLDIVVRANEIHNATSK